MRNGSRLVLARSGVVLQLHKDGGYGNNAPVVSDDVSEMTRGSGFTGVSEILDGKAIIADLERTYQNPTAEATMLYNCKLEE